jgi:hypothetical protein
MVLSAGRCGTGWLGRSLEAVAAPLRVESEPIGPHYAPRRFFRCYEDPEAMLEVPEIRRHLSAIERGRDPYIELGWPLFSALPLLAKRIPDRLRILHLTRHPVPNALALLARRLYAGGPRDDAYTRLAVLGPEDPNVFQPHYAAHWDHLSPYERCLFTWTEVNLFGLELPGRIDGVPVLRLRAEDVLAGDRETLSRLLGFIGVPWDERWLELAGVPADRWPRAGADAIDPLEVHRHPATVEAAREIGYRLDGLNQGELLERAPESAISQFRRATR